MQSRSKLDWSDALLVSSIVLLVALFGLECLNPFARPGEDAAILLRYAQHLAGGYGILWNIGEKPVDGATDFLFMVVVAGMAKSGGHWNLPPDS